MYSLVRRSSLRRIYQFRFFCLIGMRFLRLGFRAGGLVVEACSSYARNASHGP